MYNDKILVFLSRPNPFLDAHQYFILKLQEQFDKYNIQTVTLQADNYDLTDSINYLTNCCMGRKSKRVLPIFKFKKSINIYIYLLILSILCLRVFIPDINVFFCRFEISLSF